MNICVYGASSNLIDKIYIQKTEELGEIIGNRGHGLVFGGGANGLMGAVARGVHRKGGNIIGIAPSFFDIDGVLFKHCNEFVYTETMRERKRILEEKSDAFITVPGGMGTFDELFEIVTLRQLGQHEKPIVIYNIDGYYDDMLKMFDSAVKRGFITKALKDLIPVFEDAEELVEYLENYKPDKYDFSILKKVEGK